MKRKWTQVAALTFSGARFQGHALDMDAIAELPKFQKMFVAIAKETWRKRNPGRKRLPDNFDRILRLRVRRIGDGSAVVPLEIPAESIQDCADLFGEDNSVAEEAVRLFHKTISSLQRGEPLPESIPRAVVNDLSEWGNFEGEDESISILVSNRKPARFDLTVKNRVQKYLSEPYQDEVELQGEVFEADVKSRRFQMRLADERRVAVDFSEDQEETITTALKDHRVRLLGIKGLGLFTPSGALLKVVSVGGMKIGEPGESPLGQGNLELVGKPIWEELLELVAEIPAKKWKNVPSDLSTNIDTYLYGKKSE